MSLPAPHLSIWQDKQYTYDVKLRCFRVTVVVVEKQSVTYSEYVFVALVI
jgi:hypothetical protein